MNKKKYKVEKECISRVLEIVLENYFFEKKKTEDHFSIVFPEKNQDLKDTPENRLNAEKNGELSVGFYKLKNAISEDKLSKKIEVSEELIKFCLMNIEQNVAVKYNLIEKPSSLVFGGVNYDYYCSSIQELKNNKKFPDLFYYMEGLIKN